MSKSQLNPESVLQMFQAEGILNQTMPGFERRESQEKMLEDILAAFNDSSIAFIEAGTGTGKSFAYLIPAILWAHLFKETVVISTKTIQLQEQLMEKDIPFLAKALKIDFKAVLVKGMSNYLCLRKLDEAKHQQLLYSLEESEQISQIDSWQDKTVDGSLSDLPFMPLPNVWSNLHAEHDTCNHRECPHYKECHFFKARRNAQGAQLLIVNHHLLFSDLSQRLEEENYDEAAVLPAYTRIVLDEAHHIEDIATHYFASELSHASLLANIGKLASDRIGKLKQLQTILQKKWGFNLSPEHSAIFEKLNIDLPNMRNNLQLLISNTFGKYAEFLDRPENSKQADKFSGENKLRIMPELQRSHPWQEEVISPTKQLIDEIRSYVVTIQNINKNLEALKDPQLDEQTKSVRFEISAFANRLDESSSTLQKFIDPNAPESRVRWFELKRNRQAFHLRLVNAEIDPSAFLPDLLFKKFNSIVLCSATLTTNKEFNFIRKRLGVVEQKVPKIPVIEKIYDSPFNFQKQALFIVPSDMPSPLEPAFMDVAPEQVMQIIKASQGNAFVLFTSYQMLKTFYSILEERLKKQGFHPLKQGDGNRQTLIAQFKAKERSVLFGTDSFWEGVDIAGDKLRCVIITKLPFKVPSEPITQARMEYITSQGGDPFRDYSLPEAVMKFKQGFGRLIRHKTDRGCVVCLDSRLMHKSYGRQFLNSLPSLTQLFIPVAQIPTMMQQFYAATNNLGK